MTKQGSIDNLSLLVREWIISRKASSDIVDRLKEASLEEMREIEKIVSLSPSANTFKELIKLVDEVAFKDRITPSDVFCKAEVAQFTTEIQKETSTNKKFRLSELRRVLELLRYPVRKRIEELLLSLQKQVENDFGACVDLPKNMEGDNISITFKARSPMEIEEVGRRIVLHASSNNIKRIFDVLAGVDIDCF